MTRTWIYLINPFLTAGIKNFKKAVKISTYTDAALFERKLDPFFGPLNTTYHTFHVALIAAYNAWKAQGGSQKGSTLSLQQFLHVLSPGKINTWDAGVQAVFAKGSPGYVAIFPEGHKPFGAGTIDQRVNAVETLSVSLTGQPPLATVKTDVDTFYGQVNNARIAQEGDISDTSSDSDTVEAAVRTAMNSLYSILGSCINHFPSSPESIEPIFDLETIRDHQQAIWTGHLAANEQENILEHTFAGTDSIDLESTGDTALSFYMAANALDGPAGQTLINVAANSTVTVTASAFGNLANHFLHVVNNDAVEGSFRVSL